MAQFQTPETRTDGFLITCVETRTTSVGLRFIWMKHEVSLCLHTEPSLFFWSFHTRESVWSNSSSVTLVSPARSSHSCLSPLRRPTFVYWRWGLCNCESKLKYVTAVDLDQQVVSGESSPLAPLLVNKLSTVWRWADVDRWCEAGRIDPNLAAQTSEAGASLFHQTVTAVLFKIFLY